MALVPSPWARKNSPLLVHAFVTAHFVHDSLTTFVGATAITAALTQVITPTTLTHDDTVARIVTFNLICDGTVVTRNLTLRITGLDDYGETRTEDIPLVGATAGQTRAYFSRFAYRALTSIAFASKTAIGAADTISAGVVLTSGTAGTPGTQTNGARADHFKGFQLPIQPLTNMSGVNITTVPQVEVNGQSIKQGTDAAGDFAYRTPINRVATVTTGLLVDALFGIMVPDENPVLVSITGAATPADNSVCGFHIHCTTNRGE